MESLDTACRALALRMTFGNCKCVATANLSTPRVHSPIGARCPRIGGMEAKQLKAELMKEMEAEIDQLVESYKHSGPLTMTQLRYWQHDNA